jgi:CelD/BcsL family acetyltransferase involved in cellulose biosynthesis
MHIDIIDTLEALRSAKTAWDSAYAEDPDAQVFMSWGWIYSWFEKLGHQWIVLAARAEAGSRHVGFLPLQLRTERGSDGQFRSELRTGGGYFAGYTGYICDAASEPAVTAALAEALKRLRWARLHLENIFLSPDRLSRFLGQFPVPDFVTGKVKRPDDGDGIDHDIYVYVELPATWDDFLEKRLGPETRRSARRTLRPVDSGDGFSITHVSAETLHADIDALLKFWENQWGAKLAARYHAALPGGMMRNFRRMLLAAFEHGILYLPVMRQGGVAVGVQASLIDWKNRSLVGMLNGRDLGVKKPSPGFALHLHSVRWAIENGFRTYDLQTGDFPYKYDFGGIERRVECLLIRAAHAGDNRLEPRTLPVVLARAEALFQAGKTEEAALACRQILEAAPSYEGASQLLARVGQASKAGPPKTVAQALQAQKEGRLVEAEEICRAILAGNSLDFESANLLGIVMLQQKKYEAAEHQIAAAIGIRPTAPSSHYNRSIALLALGRRDDALASLAQAISLKPDYERAINLQRRIAGDAT